MCRVRARLDLRHQLGAVAREVLAGLLQKRSAFSHNVIPDQLFSRYVAVISIFAVRALTRGSPPDSDM
jgi:hypothetical protein